MPIDGIVYVLGLILGWPLRSLRSWLDRRPQRDPAQISTLHKLGRLALGSTICLLVLTPLAWIVLR